ncbi:hypothetical protein AB0B45_31920 [Nonomuraea sp. NPDC049152]|uniref:hypothetical protein n=1 Tax=Nonomuraea sp. NPDC049152 TaxID=3154350 RepID=UPI0033F26978
MPKPWRRAASEHPLAFLGLWRGGNSHPTLDSLVSAFVAEADNSRWLEYDPTRGWLPNMHLTG